MADSELIRQLEARVNELELEVMRKQNAPAGVGFCAKCGSHDHRNSKRLCWKCQDGSSYPKYLSR